VSRIGKKPIEILDGVKVTLSGEQVVVDGPKGSLTRKIVPGVAIDVQEKKIVVKNLEEGRQGRAKQGLYRALIANMVKGVHQGFERVLEISGVGYRAEKSGKSIVFQLGYSQPFTRNRRRSNTWMYGVPAHISTSCSLLRPDCPRPYGSRQKQIIISCCPKRRLKADTKIKRVCLTYTGCKIITITSINIYLLTSDIYLINETPKP